MSDNKPIRILQVVTTMDAGGIETLLMNLYRNIDRSKVQFDFLTHRDYKGFYEKEILAMGGKIYRMIPITPTKIPKYLRLMRKFFKDNPEYKVVHSHINAWSYLVLKAAKKAGVNVRISHSHNANSVLKNESFLRLRFKDFCRKNIKKQTTYRFACSQMAGEWLYYNDKDFNILKNSIDTQKFVFDEKIRNDIRKELGIKNEVVMGHVGRMEEPKNHLFLIDIFKEFTIIEPNSKLVLVGEGHLKTEIEKKAEKLNIKDKIIFTGVRTDVNRVLQAMDVYVFPSLFEGLGIAIVEAQTAGLPVIMSDTIPNEVCITDLVKVLPLNSPQRWAKVAQESLKGFIRRNTRDEIVAAGYDIKETVDWLCDFYEKEYRK